MFSKDIREYSATDAYIYLTFKNFDIQLKISNCGIQCSSHEVPKGKIDRYNLFTQKDV